MKYRLIACVGLLLILNACNNNTVKEASNNAESADTTTVVNATVTADAPYDPDPTDTIPGNQYGINSSSSKTADLVRSTLQKMFQTDLEKNLIDSLSRKFIFFEYDLNEDGKKEIFVGVTGPYFCGSGGCSQFLLDDAGNVITKFSVSRDIVIDNNKTNGYKDLFIYSGGKNRIAKYNGKTYPSNPSTLPALKELPGDGLPRALNFVNEPYPWFRF